MKIDLDYRLLGRKDPRKQFLLMHVSSSNSYNRIPIDEQITGEIDILYCSNIIRVNCSTLTEKDMLRI